jgi:GxxExxY protein
MEREELDRLARRVLDAAQRISRVLGVGFLEKVYENALVFELRRAGYAVGHQVPIRVLYEGRVVGEYYADIVVEEELIVELKASDAIARVHRLQCLNYLRASDLRLGLMLNFGTPRLEIARIANRF